VGIVLLLRRLVVHCEECRRGASSRVRSALGFLGLDEGGVEIAPPEKAEKYADARSLS
jgi:hypothetical protein